MCASWTLTILHLFIYFIKIQFFWLGWAELVAKESCYLSCKLSTFRHFSAFFLFATLITNKPFTNVFFFGTSHLRLQEECWKPSEIWALHAPAAVRGKPLTPSCSIRTTRGTAEHVPEGGKQALKAHICQLFFFFFFQKYSSEHSCTSRLDSVQKQEPEQT